MTLILLAYLGGVLTILSPCILPVLPFVFARAGQSFVRSGLPMLLGMAITFALVATLAAVGGAWAVHANQYGRYIALVILALFGLTLLLPHLADRLMQPFVSLGARLSTSAEGGEAATVGILVGAARHRHRTSVGAVRGTDPRARADRRRAARRERRHVRIAARVRGRRGDVARGRAADRRTRVRGDEEIARRRRVDTSRARRRGARRGRRDRIRVRHGCAGSTVDCEHDAHRTGAAREGRRRRRRIRRPHRPNPAR